MVMIWTQQDGKIDTPCHFFLGGGGIEDPTDFDATDAKNMEVFELCVSFVVVGWYEWYDKINLNVLQSNFHQG